MQWPFFISSLILGFGWITLYGPAGFVSVRVQAWLGTVPGNLYSIPGMAVTEAVALAGDRPVLGRRRRRRPSCAAGVEPVEWVELPLGRSAIDAHSPLSELLSERESA